MKVLFHIILLTCAASAFSATLFTRELLIGGKGTELRSAGLKLFLPDSVKGVQLKNRQNQIQPLTLIWKNGGEAEFFFNAKSGDRFKLEYLDRQIRSPEAEQKSGLLHYFKEYNGATVNSKEDFSKFWKNSVRTRAGWEKRLYLGFNRLGNANNSLNLYRGFLNIEKPGKYTFHTASTDASFLFIDDRLVASYPGRHWISPAQTGRFKGTIELSKGIHKIEYWHANNQWSYYVIAAISRPGDKKMTILPETAFLPLLPVSCGKLKNADNSNASDLSWNGTGTLDIDGRQMREFTFSDGSKIYRFDGGPFRKNGYTIHPGYHFGAPYVSNQKAKEMLEHAVNQAEQEDIGQNGYRFLADAIPMFRADGISRKFYDLILHKGDSMPQDSVFKFYRAMMMDDDLAAERYGKIEKELKRMLGKNTSHARLELAKLYFYCMDRTADAEREFKQVNYNGLTPAFKREYRLLECDMALFSKGYDEAWNICRKLESATKKMSEREKLEADGSLVSLRNALVTKRYQDAMQYLERVEKLRPEIRLNPELVWLKARFLDALKRSAPAAWHAKAALKMQPAPSTAAGAMLLLGKYKWNRGDKSKASVYFRDILTQFPKSAEALAAEKYLDGGPK